MLAFRDCGPGSVEEAASRRFGLAYLYPIQRLVIQNILEAADPEYGASEPELPPRQIVILPTGAGKSICFQLPAVLLPNPTVVVYPLLSLMEDQRISLERRGIGYAVLKGGQEAEERREALSRLKSGEARIAITNPETLRESSIAEGLRALKPSHLAIDEAHCVADWGDSFRPAYLELGELARKLGAKAVSAFTATASPSVLDRCAEILFGGETYRIVAGNPDRANLHYSVEPCLSRDRALRRLAMELPKPLIVFAPSRAGVERIASLLSEQLCGTEVRFYHAGLEKAEKAAIEAWFKESDDGILAATCAYGMGVDKRNIRSVVHYEAPASVEAYIQEAGRAGRDGEPCRAVLLSEKRGAAAAAKAAAFDEAKGRRDLAEYESSLQGCRRERLLSLLGSRLETACTGCDRCDGSDRRRPEGEHELLGSIRNNPRRYNSAELTERLLGGPCLEPPLSAGHGALRDWRRAEIQEGLAALIAAGAVRVRKGPLWRGRLECGKSEPGAAHATPGRYAGKIS